MHGCDPWGLFGIYDAYDIYDALGIYGFGILCISP
jgi:hypothetical protein